MVKKLDLVFKLNALLVDISKYVLRQRGFHRYGGEPTSVILVDKCEYLEKRTKWGRWEWLVEN